MGPLGQILKPASSAPKKKSKKKDTVPGADEVAYGTIVSLPVVPVMITTGTVVPEQATSPKKKKAAAGTAAGGAKKKTKPTDGAFPPVITASA
jgi:hypothetical protein